MDMEKRSSGLNPRSNKQTNNKRLASTHGHNIQNLRQKYFCIKAAILQVTMTIKLKKMTTALQFTKEGGTKVLPKGL